LLSFFVVAVYDMKLYDSSLVANNCLTLSQHV